jgi:hypothetical protein
LSLCNENKSRVFGVQHARQRAYTPDEKEREEKGRAKKGKKEKKGGGEKD